MAKKEDKKEIINPFWEHLGIMQCSLKEAKKVAKLCFDCGHVPVFIAEAGVGKSQAARQIAEELKWKPVFKFLAHLEPEDLGGIPYPDKEGKTYRFLCEETIRDVILDDQPTLLVLDEWNRGEKSVMNAAFTLMEDRMFGSHHLPDHVKIMACMNPSEGNYLVNEAEKDPAFRRRLCFIGVRTDAAIWLEYATGPGDFHPLVTGYIQASQNSLTDVNARESGKIYANPASWEKVSQTLQTMENQKKDMLDNETTLRFKLGGHIGSGMAEQFLQWAKENSTLVNPEDILKGYKKVRSRVMQLVKKPQQYDVLVAPNLYGDIISDLCAGLVGGLGMAPGANIGDEVAIFEPVHGSAPKYEGQNKVNPIAMMLSGVMMLRHLGEVENADRLEKAIAEVIAEGKNLTHDMKPEASKDQIVGTSQVADAVIEKLESNA